MTTCRRCGSRLENNRCLACFERDTRAAFPCVWVPPEVKVNHVLLDPIPGGPFPQPLSIEQAQAQGVVLVMPDGHGQAIYPLNHRVKIYLSNRST